MPKLTGPFIAFIDFVIGIALFALLMSITDPATATRFIGASAVTVLLTVIHCLMAREWTIDKEAI